MKTIEEIKCDFAREKKAAIARANSVESKQRQKQEENRKRKIEKLKPDIEKLVISFLELYGHSCDYHTLVKGIGINHEIDNDELRALDEVLRDNKKIGGSYFDGEIYKYFLRKPEISKKSWWQFWK